MLKPGLNQKTIQLSIPNMGSIRHIMRGRASPARIRLGLTCLCLILLSFCGLTSSHAVTNLVRYGNHGEGNVNGNGTARMYSPEAERHTKRMNTQGHPPPGSSSNPQGGTQQAHTGNPVASYAPQIAIGRALTYLMSLNKKDAINTLGFETRLYDRPNAVKGTGYFSAGIWQKEGDEANAAARIGPYAPAFSTSGGVYGTPVDLHAVDWTWHAYSQAHSYTARSIPRTPQTANWPSYLPEKFKMQVRS